MRAKDTQNQQSEKQNMITALLMALAALVAITAVTAAWFSISDSARVRSIGLNVEAGPSVRFDLDEHRRYEDYVKTLGFDQIAKRMKQDLGFDMEETPLDPVTTDSAVTFHLKNGEVVADTTGKYLTFTLHFMATKDVLIHLTPEPGGREDDDGTLITSKLPGMAQAMRISFTADDQTLIYVPSMGDKAERNGSVKQFGLPSPRDVVYNDNNYLFDLTGGEDKEVLVHIWLEGTDPACTNDLKGGDYAISLRFMATDENHIPIMGNE